MRGDSASDTLTPKNGDADDAGSWLSSPKDCVFPETIPEEASSVEEERVVIFHLPPSSALGASDQPSFYAVDAALLQQQVANRANSSELQRAHFTFDPEAVAAAAAAATPQPKTSTSTEKDSTDGQQTGSFRIGNDNDDDEEEEDNGADGVAGSNLEATSETDAAIKVDVFAATFLDVAVLRCLFVEHWQEDGVYWCLHYMYNR